MSSMKTNIPTLERLEKTLGEMVKHMRTRGLSHKTVKAYHSATQRFLLWQRGHWESVKGMTPSQRRDAFLSALANNRSRPISFPTQKAYGMALLYFYREFQGKELAKVKAARAKPSQRIFNLLTLKQLAALFEALPDACRENYRLMAMLMFGTGMRLDEVICLRVKDIRFDEGLIAVQEGKGDKAGFVDLPKSLVDELKKQLDYNQHLFEMDRKTGKNGVYLPNSLGAKYPAYGTSWEWFWVFPHWTETRDEAGVKRRHHINDYYVGGAFREARRRLKLPEYATAHMMRHCYASFYLRNLLKKVKESGLDMPDLYGFCRDALRKKLRHVSPQTTEIYIHLAMERNDITDASPLDILNGDGK